jgi:hypothetical protein
MLQLLRFLAPQVGDYKPLLQTFTYYANVALVIAVATTSRNIDIYVRAHNQQEVCSSLTYTAKTRRYRERSRAARRPKPWPPSPK